jgi:hypothetical protein
MNSGTFPVSLRSRELLYGTLLTIPSPEIAEILSGAPGLSWIFLDLEHSAMGSLEAQRMLQLLQPRLPVLVRVEYHIDSACLKEFLHAMRPVGRARRRSGASRWSLWRDMAVPGRVVELFVVESWAEHLRQHERVTVSDQEAEQRAYAFHIGETPPVVYHLIAASEASASLEKIN